jgi:hypothetical protein
MSQKLEKLLLDLDESHEKTSEHAISSQINEVTSDDQNTDAVAERIAFSFCEDYADKNTGWGTYFGPIMVWTGDDGQIYEDPSLSLVSKEIINYWINRAAETNNHLMKARYLGLIWDFSKKTLSTHPKHKVAIQYIKSLIEVCDQDLLKHSVEAITKITRAYKVASSLNEAKLVKKCIQSAINLEERIAEDDEAGSWGFCFELFVLGRCEYLPDKKKNQLIADLEARFSRASLDQSLWVCESAGIPLATYYRRENKPDDVKRVIELVGNCFESSCKGLPAMQVSAQYQRAHDIYISFNLKENAKNVSKKISEIGPDLVESMQKISYGMKISMDELDSYLNAMTNGGLETTLKRIAITFTPQKDQVKRQVLDLAKKNPISYHVTKILQDHKGRSVATIGGIAEDLEGNIIHQLSQNMSINSFFLRHSFKKLTKTYRVNAKDLTEFILQSSIFEETKREIIQSGVEAFLKEDYISAIHVLMPQAESAIRALVEVMGGAILSRNKQGGFQLRTFGDLLRDETVKQCFGDNLSFYFRILLTDQRGWNMRNNVCHGISPANAFSYSMADRIMHIMLCLAQVREK